MKNFDELFHEMTKPDRHLLQPLLAGHLALEFLLRTLLNKYDTKLSRHVDSLNHWKLIHLNLDLGLITKEQSEVLTLINKLRNRFAHKIDYSPSKPELLEIYRKAKLSFSDLTDGIIQGLEELDSIEDVSKFDEFVFQDLFMQISYDLNQKFVEIGGNEFDYQK